MKVHCFHTFMCTHAFLFISTGLWTGSTGECIYNLSTRITHMYRDTHRCTSTQSLS